MKKSVLFQKVLLLITAILIFSDCYSQHYSTIWMGNPYQPMSIIIQNATINGINMESGDEIAVFDIGDGGASICVGTAVLTGTATQGNPLIVTAGADDPLTSGTIDGYTAGNEITFKFWDNSESTEILIVIPIYNVSFDIVYTALGTSLVTNLQGFTAVETTAGSVTTCQGNVSLPIYVENVNIVTEFTLLLNHNINNLSYTGYQNTNSQLNSGTLYVTENNGEIIISWNSITPANIISGTLIELLFTASTVYSQTIEDLLWDENISYYKNSNGISFETEFNNGQITIDPIPADAGSITGVDSICQGSDNISYQLGAITNATSYVWDLNPATAGTITGSGTNITIDFSLSYSGEAILSVCGSNSCGNGTSSLLVIAAIANPTVNAGSDEAICEDISYTLSGSANNQQSVLWTSSGDGSFDDASLLAATYTPGTNDISNGSLSLTLTAYAIIPCGTDAVDDMILTIQELPTVNAGEDATICEDISYTLSGSANNHQSVLWTTSGDGSFDDASLLSATYTPGTNDISNGSLNLTLTAYAIIPCGTDAVDDMILTIQELPTVNAGEDETICEDISCSLSGSANNYQSVLWTTSGDGSFDDASLLSATYTPGTNDISNGSLNLTLTAYAIIPCGTDAVDDMILTIQELPTAYAGEDALIMQGESYYIFDATASNYESLEWSTDGSGYFDDPNTINPTYFPDSGETGIIILTLSVDGFAPCSTVYSSMNLEILGEGYPLNVGYQFVSSRIIPYSPNMLDVLSDNLENIDFVRNSAGLMFRKIGPVWVNSIGDWITTEGYIFKMNSEDELTISGEIIDPQTPIDLVLGYQIISYLPESPINTLDVFADVLSNLDFVRNSAGLMFRKIGPVWVNSIGDMQAGEGYLVKMNAEDVLIYPETSDNLIANKTPMPEHFKVIEGNPYDPVWTIYFEQATLNIGDEIGVYDGEILAGAGVVNSDNILENSIPVFSNLYKSGNYPIFKVWSKNKNKEFLLLDYFYVNHYGDAYLKEKFPETDGEYSMLNFFVTGVSDKYNNHPSLTIYPNPSEGIFNISIERLSGDLQCKVMDLRGNDYCNFEFNGIHTDNKLKGFTIKQLDLKELPAGVYIISFIGRNLSKVEKIIIQ